MTERLGFSYDLSAGIAPVDFSTGAATGKRVNLKNAGGVEIIIFVGAAGSGTDALTFTLQEHNASSSGTSQNLACITRYWTKLGTTLAGTETWTAGSQAAAATVAIAGADAAKQGIIVVSVEEEKLSDGFTYISLSAADPGAVARVGGVLYMLRDLKVQRKPSNLVAPLS